MDIARSRVEGLLAAFSKMVNPDSESTFIETENVRYLYQPLDTVYMLLITNRSSNIIEDLDTLHLMAKLVGGWRSLLSLSLSLPLTRMAWAG